MSTVVHHPLHRTSRKCRTNQIAFPPTMLPASYKIKRISSVPPPAKPRNTKWMAGLCLFGHLYRFTSSSSRPHLADSSPSSHSFSTYPSSLLTFSTVALSPVFFPILSLHRVSLVSRCPQPSSTHLILIAGFPPAELSLMTMFNGVDLVPVLVWTKSLVR